MIDMEGNRTEGFDQFLKRNVEDPAVPGMKRLAAGAALDFEDPSKIALFLALTMARSPAMMHSVLDRHVHTIAPDDRTELEDLVKLWCHWTARPYGPNSHNEFLKPSSFGAVWVWSQRKLCGKPVPQN
jgi:hypothetical protein